nr:MAG TPA: hypothetical protein [Caudoviricetes sp.]
MNFFCQRWPRGREQPQWRWATCLSYYYSLSIHCFVSEGSSPSHATHNI